VGIWKVLDFADLEMRIVDKPKTSCAQGNGESIFLQRDIVSVYSALVSCQFTIYRHRFEGLPEQSKQLGL